MYFYNYNLYGKIYKRKGILKFFNDYEKQKYALLCLKQVIFEDGRVWNNPEYESLLQTYSGKETGVDTLENYYPYETGIVFD